MNPNPDAVREPRNELLWAQSAIEDLRQRGGKVMKRFGRVLVLTASLGVFAVLATVLPGHQAAAAGPTVTVANTPLPVAGTVSATVTGNVNANITNATVPVSGTVAVGNTSSNPVLILNLETSSRIPYRSNAELVCNQLGCGPVSLTAPPAGFRLVITEVSATLPPTSPSPTVPFLFLGGGLGDLFVPGTVSQDGSGIINQQVNYVLDPTDSAPTINSQNDFGTSGGLGQVTLTGYLVNCSVVVCPPIQN